MRINKLSSNIATVMSDINARHVTRGTESTARGNHLQKWAKDNGRRLYGPEEPSCVTPRVSSLPDIIPRKDIDGGTAISRRDRDIGGDHFVIEMNVNSAENNPPMSPL